MKSTHQAIVVPIKLENHPHADALSIVKVDGYVVVVRTQDWEDKDKGVFIPIENLVDTDREEFVFLKKNKRWQKIKNTKLRGIHSQGILIPAPPNTEVGDDLTKELDVKHQDDEKKVEKEQNKQGKSPSGLVVPKYDIEAFKKYHKDFVEGETVICTEKCHGANLRMVYSKKEDQIFVGSRTNWWKADGNNIYWRGFYSNERVFTNFLKTFPDYTLRGELYGQVQKGYNYGLKKGKVGVVLFDIMRPDLTYLDFDSFNEICFRYVMHAVPIIGRIPYNFDKVVELAEGPSLLERRNGSDKETPREGVVVKPIKERLNDRFERVIYKVIGHGYKG